MSRSDDIGSGFEKLPDGEGGVVPVRDDGDAKRGIDFARARLLSTEGTNCDTFLVTRSNKLLLVKRLKEEHRFKPRHRSAIAKEFELGYHLRHSNLPVYLECGEDYLVMDYVEGDTLRKLIANNDKYLHKPENLRRIFEQLIDVVDYLHHENVTHCDIKADNVMLTLRNHNLMLIDLGNAYADWHPMTAGAARAYGVESGVVGSTDIDFHGVGRIVDELTEAGFNTRPLQRFRSLCDKEDVTADELREALAKRQYFWAYIVAGIVVASLIALLLTIRLSDHNATNDASGAYRSDTIVVKEAPVEIVKPNESPVAKPTATAPDYKAIINSEMPERLEPLDQLLTKYETMLADPATIDAVLNNAIFEVSTLKSKLTQEAYAHYQEQFADVPTIDVQMAVASSPVYQQLSSRFTTLSKNIAEEQRRRQPEAYEE